MGLSPSHTLGCRMISSAQNPIDLHVGQRTQLARALAGLELQELADALQITPQQLRGHEAGERMGAATLFAVAKILNQPVSFFFEGLPSD